MDCDCGATTEGEFAGVHSPNCASERFAPRHLELSDPLQEVGCDPHRPRISVWIDENEIGRSNPAIAMSIGSLWAQPSRYVDLYTSEARRLGHYLIEKADALDSLKSNAVESVVPADA